MIFGGCCGTTAEHVRALAEKSGALRMNPPAPEQNGLLPCATEKELFFLDPTVPAGKALPCDGELEDRLEEAMGEDAPLVTVELRAEAELENFADAQVLITKPLCIRCEDAALLEQALRLYQGRALYDGPLGEAALKPLAKKYGVIY
jgi:5-methyltetrahydrofolate--homocysteine methyltransferase